MHRKMTITVDEESVRGGCIEPLGKGASASFLRTLCDRTCSNTSLDEGYKAMAADKHARPRRGNGGTVCGDAANEAW